MVAKPEWLVAQPPYVKLNPDGTAEFTIVPPTHKPASWKMLVAWEQFIGAIEFDPPVSHDFGTQIYEFLPPTEET